MGLPALAADHLFIAPLLCARLKGQMPELECEAVETVEQMLAADHREAVLLVMWAGDGYTDRNADGRNQLLMQRWLAVVALNNVGKLPDARQLRAGPLMSRVHKAVAGWTPEGAVRTFRRVTAPLRPDIVKTKALYPLAFEIELSL